MNAPSFTYLGPRTVVTYPGRKPREVKNLGWIIRNAAEVDSITLSPRDDGASNGCVFLALLSDGRTYRTAFESIRIAKNFVQHRRFGHVQVTIHPLPPEF